MDVGARNQGGLDLGLRLSGLSAMRSGQQEL